METVTQRDYAVTPMTPEENDERMKHVVVRAKERANCDMSGTMVQDVEARIRKTWALLQEGKTLSPIKPQLLWNRKKRRLQHWQVLVSGKPIVFIFDPLRGCVSVESDDMKQKRLTALAEKAK